MNQQDVEIAIEVIKERLNIHLERLRDVDECCGKLKGSTSQEFRMLGERITALEHDMGDNCKDVQIDVQALQEKVKSQCDAIKKLQEDLDSIHKTYRNVTVEFILAVLLGIIALFIHL